MAVKKQKAAFLPPTPFFPGLLEAAKLSPHCHAGQSPNLRQSARLGSWVKLICLYQFYNLPRTPEEGSLTTGQDKGKFLSKFRKTGAAWGAVSYHI